MQTPPPNHIFYAPKPYHPLPNSISTTPQFHINKSPFPYPPKSKIGYFTNQYSLF